MRRLARRDRFGRTLRDEPAARVADLGPEGGDAGGRLVAEGPPEAIAACEASHTGRFLREAAVVRA